jgi:predicted HAD superfamily phosphohydrolase
MKTNNSNPSRRRLMAIAAVMLFSSITFSCKKDVSQVTSSKNTIDEAVVILGGKKLSGKLTSSQNENGLALTFNNGASYILLEKIPGADLAVIPATSSAEIDISDYGVVINDATNNKTLLFANNDQQSLAKMEKVKSCFNNSSEISKVFGVTTVNAAN